ncbi:MAG: hypothetical protein IPG83_11175 [Novosphingobium sp.]|nr:hypothetical protein [Novosphingobium sp.]
MRRYVHGVNGGGDDPLAWYEGAEFASGNERLLRGDWQGSIVAIAATGGASMFAINRYDAFGIPNVGNTGRFQYTGQAWLAELGLYLSIGVQSGPPIGVQKGPPCSCGDWLMLGACFALLAA